MAPSPENDNAPKAPDKNEKCREDAHPESRLMETENTTTGPENKEASVSRLDDGQLKALLDEAITYKSPKDRVGKSQLFQNLLAKAEEDDRKARATSASGSELVRHYNRSATRRNRHSKDQNSCSISENVTHGGSLNNLIKDELYNATINPLYRPPKTVSARQRQGGSLPCNVNSGLIPSYEFVEEARKIKETNQAVEYTAIDMESESLLEHDSLNREYSEQEIDIKPKFSLQYTSRATFDITPKISSGVATTSSSVDDAVMISGLERCDKSSSSSLTEPTIKERLDSSTSLIPASATLVGSAAAITAAAAANSVYPTNYTFLNVPTSNWTCNKKSTEEKKVDENGNAVGQGSSVGITAGDAKKNKKKKLQTDKNVRVLAGKDFEGHRSDIIHDVDKLMEFIGGDDASKSSTFGSKSSKSSGGGSGSGGGNVHKTKLNKQHGSNEERGGSSSTGGTSKKRLRTKSKGENLQKSSSMEEISSTKLEDFEFVSQDGSEEARVKVSLRNTKSNSDRPRERRSWGNSDTSSVDIEQIQNFQVYSTAAAASASAENLETADFLVVTKKKKSKRRRNNSLNGRGRQVFGRESGDDDFTTHSGIGRHRRSPESRKSIRSVPQSEKSNDSSDDDDADRDSVRSLPVTSNKYNYNNNDDLLMMNSAVPVVSYAAIARNSSAHYEPRPKWNRPPSDRLTETTTAICNLNDDDKRHSDKVEKSPPDVTSLQTWPTITSSNLSSNNIKVIDGVKGKCMASVTKQKNLTYTKNAKNNNMVLPAKENGKANCKYTNASEPMQMIRNSSETMNNASNLPHDIPDVQTIEKLHLQNVYSGNIAHENNNNHKKKLLTSNREGGVEPISVSSLEEQAKLTHVPSAGVEPVTIEPTLMTSARDNFCDKNRNKRTCPRPAVVILSGDSSKGNEVSGLTFGFEVNEQLLSDDVCERFIARFVVPDSESFYGNHKNGYDKIVNFIGKAWDDVVNQLEGQVKYYDDQL